MAGRTVVYFKKMKLISLIIIVLLLGGLPLNADALNEPSVPGSSSFYPGLYFTHKGSHYKVLSKKNESDDFTGMYLLGTSIHSNSGGDLFLETVTCRDTGDSCQSCGAHSATQNYVEFCDPENPDRCAISTYYGGGSNPGFSSCLGYYRYTGICIDDEYCSLGDYKPICHSASFDAEYHRNAPTCNGSQGYGDICNNPLRTVRTIRVSGEGELLSNTGHASERAISTGVHKVSWYVEVDPSGGTTPNPPLPSTETNFDTSPANIDCWLDWSLSCGNYTASVCDFSYKNLFQCYADKIETTSIFTTVNPVDDLPSGGSSVYTVNAGQYGTHDIDFGDFTFDFSILKYVFLICSAWIGLNFLIKQDSDV